MSIRGYTDLEKGVASDTDFGRLFRSPGESVFQNHYGTFRKFTRKRFRNSNKSALVHYTTAFRSRKPKSTTQLPSSEDRHEMNEISLR